MIKKILLGIVITTMSLLLLLVVGLIINQQVQQNQDLNALEEKGMRIETDHGAFHVHQFGSGEPLVFLSGLGTTAPLYDFKPLWHALKDEYEIIVIERPGYGYNDSATRDKEIDTIVDGYKATLDALEIEDSVTLVAHSLGGLEAIRWAQKDANQIKQIIALDPAIAPMVLEHQSVPNIIERNIQFMVGRLGVARFMDEQMRLEALPLLNYESFDASEEEAIKTLFHAQMFNRNIVREITHIEQNAEIIASDQTPADTPVLVLISQENLDDNEHAKDVFDSYFNDFNDTTTHILNTYHYVHHEKYDEILNAFNDFIAD